MNCLDAFRSLEGGQVPCSTLDSDILLVRVLEEEEAKTKSGLIIASTANQVNTFNASKPIFAEVLRVGPGYYDDDGKTVPLNAEPGNIIAVGQNACPVMHRYGALLVGDNLRFGYVRASEVIERWPSLSAYKEYFQALSDAMAEVPR